MPLQINDIAPNFTAETTEGKIRFHDWIGNNWVVLFSHPKDFTPVCTTELGTMARLKPEFDKRWVKIIEALVHKFDGGPVGLNSLGVAIGEDAGTLEEVHEPYLIMQGYLKRTPQGRVALAPAYRKLGLTPPARSATTGDLFG